MKKWFLIGGAGVIALLIIVVGVTMARGNDKQNYNYYKVGRGSVAENVSVTGKVVSADTIDLAFEINGKVANVAARVGDKVIAGQTLATLKNDDLTNQVAQAAAGVDAAAGQLQSFYSARDAQQAKLNDLKAGTRPEALEMTQRKITSAQKTLDDAKQNLQNANVKANADLSQLYTDSANSTVNAVNTALNSLNVISDIQYNRFGSNDQDSYKIVAAKTEAVEALVGVNNGGRWSFSNISNEYGGARGAAMAAQADPTNENVLLALNNTYQALLKMNDLVNSIPFSGTVLTPTEKASLVLERTNLSAQTSTISAKLKAIDTQKAANSNILSAAQMQIDQAESNLSLANQELVVEKSGASSDQIAAQEAALSQVDANIFTGEAQVRAAQAALDLISAQYSKSLMNSPVDGMITKVDIEAGEMAGPAKSIITLSAAANLQIETYIPESDVAKIQNDSSAKVTLDAYGSEEIFDAKVIKIDPAETLINNVSTYKATLQFSTNDEKIKSGMTANIKINAAKKDNVLIVPQNSIIKKVDGNYVMMPDASGNLKQIKIVAGIAGDEGMVEVISGLNEGDKIVKF